MFYLILGPNNSGKSAYAEQIIEILGGDRRYYIATMIPYGEEGKARVEKHLRMREHLGMITVEDPYLEKIGEALAQAKTDGDNVEVCEADVLLEDLSNLVANRLFEKGQESCDIILQDLLALQKKVKNLVIVSIAGIVAEGFDEETTNYVNQLNALNHQLENLADQVIYRE